MNQQASLYLSSLALDCCNATGGEKSEDKRVTRRDVGKVAAAKGIRRSPIHTISAL